MTFYVGSIGRENLYRLPAFLLVVEAWLFENNAKSGPRRLFIH
jgi:hypothetical protein